MAKNWLKTEALIENLEEEALGINDKDLIKILDWLYDEQMLSNKGREFLNDFYNYTKIKQK